MAQYKFRQAASTYHRVKLPSTLEQCPEGRRIGLQTEAENSLPPGDCEVCGAGPLHGPRRGGGPCPCSHYRNDLRLCRLCACIFDIYTTGHTRIRIGGDAAMISIVVKRTIAILQALA